MKITPADQRDQHNRARYGALGVVGLLGERADGVEAQERVRRDRRAGRERREPAVTGERPQRQKRLRVADEVGDRQHDKDHQDQKLEGHQHEVRAVCDLAGVSEI